jgi:hypothetical protein
MGTQQWFSYEKYLVDNKDVIFSKCVLRQNIGKLKIHTLIKKIIIHHDLTVDYIGLPNKSNLYGHLHLRFNNKIYKSIFGKNGIMCSATSVIPSTSTWNCSGCNTIDVDNPMSAYNCESVLIIWPYPIIKTSFFTRYMDISYHLSAIERPVLSTPIIQPEPEPEFIKETTPEPKVEVTPKEEPKIIRIPRYVPNATRVWKTPIDMPEEEDIKPQQREKPKVKDEALELLSQLIIPEKVEDE